MAHINYYGVLNILIAAAISVGIYLIVKSIKKHGKETMRGRKVKRREDYQLDLFKYTILSNGADGGHRYITASIRFDGVERTLAVFFADKADERLLMENEAITVNGTLIDEHPENSLLLLDAKLIGRLLSPD